MKLDISAEEFSRLSSNKKKTHIARLFIDKSGASPVSKNSNPVAVVMAGLPGAGKTEYLDSIADELIDNNGEPFVRIDLDEIVSVYPNYTPKDYYKFRSQGNIVLARTVDEARHGRYNMLIDGTFSGMSGASVDTVTHLLNDGYIIQLIYMFDDAETAWSYTVKRELETGRAITRSGFVQAAKNLTINIRKVLEKYQGNKNFSIRVIQQKALRDNDYNVITEKDDIDKICAQDYNIKQ